MSSSIDDIFEDYVDSLSNLPLEIDDNMQELRSMDEEFRKHRGTYRKERRRHLKLLENENRAMTTITIRRSRSPTTPSPTSTILTAKDTLSPTASLERVENEFKTAMNVQDQKIDKVRQMCDLASLHIEQLDYQMSQHNISAIPLCENDGQRYCHQRKSPNGSYHHPMAYGRSPNPMYTMPMGNTSSSSYHPRRLAGSSSRKYSHSAEGNRQKSSSSHGTTDFRKRTHYPARPNSVTNAGALIGQEIGPNEPRYCYCNQVSYGDMVACDGDNCEKEWFHYGCVGLEKPPVGTWFCEDCMAD